jgi:hypothetical protein
MRYLDGIAIITDLLLRLADIVRWPHAGGAGGSVTSPHTSHFLTPCKKAVLWWWWLREVVVVEGGGGG